MPRSHRRFTVAAATGSAVTLAVGIGSWVVTFVFADIDALWLAISFTVLGAVLGLLWRVEDHHDRVEDRHDKDMKRIEEIADLVVQRVVDKMTLQLYCTLGDTIKEQIDAADRLNDARRRWRQHVGTDTPVNLQWWKSGRTADGTPPS